MTAPVGRLERWPWPTIAGFWITVSLLGWIAIGVLFAAFLPGDDRIAAAPAGQSELAPAAGRPGGE